jgi:hypothetical protein
LRKEKKKEKEGDREERNRKMLEASAKWNLSGLL